MKKENFYRRNPGDALAGMVGLTLEERGVYNTIVDLLYLTWRPLEDSRAYIAAHCGCAVQKLNPIVERLIAKGKLLRFAEGPCWFLSNQRFEAERSDVKGSPKTRSGRGEVGEKSAGVEEKSEGVREKSAGVSENPPTCQENDEKKPDVSPLDRQEKTRKRNTSDESDTVSGLTAAVWAIASPESRKRSGRKDVENAVRAFLKRGGDPEKLLAGLRAYFASEQATKDGGKYAKGVHRLIEGDRWQDFAEAIVLDAISDRVRGWDRDTWAIAVRRWREDPTQWGAKMGPLPGQPGCLVPADLLIEKAA